MEFKIKNLPAMVLVGKKERGSLATINTQALWQSFMPRRTEIPNRADSHHYSVEVYDSLSYFDAFDPTKKFDKWAAIRVEKGTEIPDDFEVLEIPKGLYAVFTYKGSSREAFKAYQYIYTSWIPQSGYRLDNRPHIACMGAAYISNDPNSEEELWIPIQK